MIEFNAPRSICVCGHTGDGPKSAHVDFLAEGHGRCIIPGCDCNKFVWKRWTEPFKHLIDFRAGLKSK